MILLIIPILVVYIARVSSGLQLRQVNLIYRHGDRAPMVIYPKDINRLDKWPQGLGQLTKQGISQQLELGMWLRKRYGALVGPELYTPDLYVRSSDVPRTLMSAAANLAGFVLNDSFHALEGLPWRPVAIASESLENDYLLSFNICSRYFVERAALYDSETFKKKLRPYLQLLQVIQAQSGYSDLDFQSSWIVHDAVFCEKSHNMSVNTWITDHIWKEMCDLQAINWEIMFYKDLSRLIGGYLLHTIIENMEKVTVKLKMKEHHKKLVMYSAHDSNLAALANLLGYRNVTQPNYASVIILELYSNDNSTDQWFVKVLYKDNINYTSADIIETHHVPGCPPLLCPLAQFNKVTKMNSITLEEYKKSCTITGNGSGFNRRALYIGLGFTVTFIGLLLVFLIMFYRNQRKKYRLFSKL